MPPEESPQSSAAASFDAPASTGLTRKQLIAVGTIAIGYAALSYYGESKPGGEGVGAALSIGPVLLIATFLVGRWTRPWIAVIFAVFTGACLYRYREFFERNFEIADLIEQCGVFALIGLSFARTLLPGRVPLVTQVSQQIHGALSSLEVLYGRWATLAWAAFYLLLAAAILVLFFVVSQSAWSFFVNVATFGLIAVAVLADFALRRALLPRRPRDGLIAMLKRSLLG